MPRTSRRNFLAPLFIQIAKQMLPLKSNKELMRFGSVHSKRSSIVLSSVHQLIQLNKEIGCFENFTLGRTLDVLLSFKILIFYSFCSLLVLLLYSYKNSFSRTIVTPQHNKISFNNYIRFSSISQANYKSKPIIKRIKNRFCYVSVLVSLRRRNKPEKEKRRRKNKLEKKNKEFEE